MNEQASPELNLDIEGVSAELKIRPEIYIKIVTSFVNSLTDKMRRLNEAISLNNADQMRMILHEIKGTSGNLRLSSLSGPHELLHSAVKSGADQRTLTQHFEALQQAVQRLQKAVGQMNTGNENSA